MDFEAELNGVKTQIANTEAQLAALANKVNELSGKADAVTDGFLAKVMKSSVSWLIVLGYSFGVFTLGAVLF